MSAEKVPIDTSVWIEYFQKSDSGLSSRIDDVLSVAEVYVPGVVLAELVQGARSEREIAAIKDMTETFRLPITATAPGSRRGNCFTSSGRREKRSTWPIVISP